MKKRIKTGWTTELVHELLGGIIKYTGNRFYRLPRSKKSVRVIGLDTEAYSSGECFMVATSLGEAFPFYDFPHCLFSRRYLNKTFVAYNLSYDEGALLQVLPKKQLIELRDELKVTYKGYSFRIIPKKMLRITRGKNGITIFDMLNFYGGKLEDNAKKYLNKQKFDIETKTFTKNYVKANWNRIAKYCIQDSKLVQELGRYIIRTFEKMGVYPKKLYSTAYVTYQYFRENTKYVTVRRYWKDYREVLYYAMLSYNGGKFEVTRKGCDYYYEYDIVSAYPYEIANLYDISKARVIYDTKYRKAATYGFMYVVIDIHPDIYSPSAMKRKGVNVYPCGRICRVITKTEYEYFINNGCDVKIISAWYIYTDMKTQPYKNKVMDLFYYKDRYKKEGKDLEYHTTKILLNSLYGKFVQLIKKKEYIEASTCWNPIYGSIITANVRTRISQLQTDYKSIVAVHTDSVISTKPLDFPVSGSLGDMTYECQGDGVIIGSGVYQVGEKGKIRGFPTKTKLLDLLDTPDDKIKLVHTRPWSWREVVFHKWSPDLINRFHDEPKDLRVSFDRKRIWIDDYRSFSEIKERRVYSTPLIYIL